MADEVPDAAAQFLDLATGFLHLVFAEDGETSPHGFADVLGGLGFANGNEFNFRGIASGPAGRLGNDGLHFFQTRGEIFHHLNLWQNP